MPMKYCPECGTKMERAAFERERAAFERDYPGERSFYGKSVGDTARSRRRPKRKLSAWNKFVKANSKKPRFRYARSNKINLKKMAVAFRKKRR